MLKTPHGTTNAERLQQNAVEQAVTEIRRKGRGEAMGASSLSTSSAVLTGAGTSAVGKLGFALGLSGLGGNDWLMPPARPARTPFLLLIELT